MSAPRKSGAGAERQRSYDPVQTKQSIIRAGLKLFKRDGFSATAVKDIADEAGVTKGAFYHHFETKEDLLLLIHDDYLDYQLAAVRAAVARDADPRAQLADVIACILEALEKYHENVTIFFQERRFLTGPKFEGVRERRDALEAEFQSLLKRGVANGHFRRDLDLPIMGLGLIGMCAWSYQWYSPGGRLALPELSRIFAALALDGVAAR
jgi:AcrR family transcriptional regulator